MNQIRIKLATTAFGVIFYAIASGYEQSRWLGDQGWYFYGRRTNAGLAAKLRAAGIEQNTRWLPVSKKEIAAQILGRDGVVFDDDARALCEESAAAQVASRATDADIDVPAPDGLSYRPYQRGGIAFALDAFEAGRKGVIIGDEMGLGKTMQAIGVAVSTNAERVLVVCPASLCSNWRREISKWWPEVAGSIQVISNGDTPDATARVVVLNYEKAVGRHANAKRVREALLAQNFDLAVFDEAHLLKNEKAQRTQFYLGKYDRRGALLAGGVAQQVGRFVMLTGTPIQNNVRESITLLRAIGAFGPNGVAKNEKAFLFRYCGAQKVWTGRRHVWQFTGGTRLDELQAKLRSGYMVRRLKADVAAELPPKVRSVVAFTDHGFAHEVDGEFATAANDLDSQTRRFEELSAYRAQLAEAKAPFVVEHVAARLESSGKVIVFGHHRSMLDALSAAFGDVAVRIDGSTAPADRQAIVDRFQSDDAVRVAILSTHAAGVGLTLTAASLVIFAEADWNPSWCQQAEDRAHRIGQTADRVLAEYLTLDGTLDAHVLQTMVRKMDVADRALDRRSGDDSAAPATAPAEPTVAALVVDARAALDNPGDSAALRAALTALLARLPEGETQAAPAAPASAPAVQRPGTALVDLDGPAPF